MCRVGTSFDMVAVDVAVDVAVVHTLVVVLGVSIRDVAVWELDHPSSDDVVDRWTAGKMVWPMEGLASKSFHVKRPSVWPQVVCFTWNTQNAD